MCERHLFTLRAPTDVGRCTIRYNKLECYIIPNRFLAVRFRIMCVRRYASAGVMFISVITRVIRWISVRTAGKNKTFDWKTIPLISEVMSEIFIKIIVRVLNRYQYYKYIIKTKLLCLYRKALEVMLTSGNES